MRSSEIFDADYADLTLIAADFFLRINHSHHINGNLRKSALNLRNLRRNASAVDLQLNDFIALGLMNNLG